MTDMSDIEALAKHYGESREKLAAVVMALDDELRTVRRRRLTRLKLAVAAAAKRRQDLVGAIEANRALFKKPKTRLLHNIRLGLKKGAGVTEIPDPEITVRLIRKHLSDQADVLIKVTETPVKAAMQNLSAAELKRIGVCLVEAGDKVFIKEADSEIDKLVEALLAATDAPEDEETAP